MFPLSDSVPTRRFPFFNILIIVATSFVFFQQLTVPSGEAFIYQFVLIPKLVDTSNIATFIPFVTAIFLHGGLLAGVLFANVLKTKSV